MCRYSQPKKADFRTQVRSERLSAVRHTRDKGKNRNYFTADFSAKHFPEFLESIKRAACGYADSEFSESVKRPLASMLILCFLSQ